MRKEESVVLPAVRIPRKLWMYLEEIMRRRMFSGPAELVRDALRAYVEANRSQIGDFRIIEAKVALKGGREKDERREEELVEQAERLRRRHQRANPPLL
jgi:Arc/MetJ-type ribon-helix-helix transcriptional regulator